MTFSFMHCNSFLELSLFPTSRCYEHGYEPYGRHQSMEAIASRPDEPWRQGQMSHGRLLIRG